VPAPPSPATDVVAGVTMNAHEVEAEAWLTEIVSPATVSDPVRAAPLFDATLNDTVPLPVPLPRPTEIHDALLLADQAHPLAVLTEMELARVAEDAVIVCGVTEYVQSTTTGTTGFASCAIRTV